jgi:5-methylcytosine-specific restriction endonuclease McrA
MSMALQPGASQKPTPEPKVRKRLTGKPHRIPEKVRDDTLDDYGRLCQWCKVPGGRLDLHHKLRRSQGGKDDRTTLIPVHRTCHRFIHEHPEEARQRGFLIGTGTKA